MVPLPQRAQAMRAQQQMFALAPGGKVLVVSYEGPVEQEAAAGKNMPLLSAMSLPPGSVLAITDLQYKHFDRHLRCVLCHVRSPLGVIYACVCTHVSISAASATWSDM